MAEEDGSNTFTSNIDPEGHVATSGHDFYLLSEEDIANVTNVGSAESDSSKGLVQSETKTAEFTSSVYDPSKPVDVEVIKRKAEELAKSLQRARNKVGRNASTSSTVENYEAREDLKPHRERSLYVEQKLKEDRKLFEESKKRSEAVFDKVRSVKRIQESLNESVKELNRKDPDDTLSLKLKIQRLEDSVSRLQDSLANKNRVISEKNEQIRTLSKSVSETHDAYARSLEQSELDINRVKEEYRKKFDDVVISKDELTNQLQLIRKNYLTVENDLKLSDFARSRLVNRNAELRERIIALENENERLSVKLSEKTGPAESSPQDEKQSPACVSKELRSKVENLVIIANEFSACLADDLNDLEELNVDNDDDDDDVSQTIDAVGDKLEAVFFTMRDKLSALPKLRSNLEKMNDEFHQMDVQLRKNEQYVAQLEECLSLTQAKLDEAIKQRAELAESAHKAEWKSISKKLDTMNRKLGDALRPQRGNELEMGQLREELSSIEAELNAEAREKTSFTEEDCDAESQELQNALFSRRDDDPTADSGRLLEELRNECAQLNAELQCKSREIESLVGNVDALEASVQSLQHERVELLDELHRKTDECDGIRRAYDQIDLQLRSLQQNEKPLFYAEQFERLSDDHQQLERVTQELRSKCDRLEMELRAKTEQLEKENVLRHPAEEAFEKEENDFVVLQTRDCDDEDSVKRQCVQLRDLNEKLMAKVRSLNEKTVEFENDRLSLGQCRNECASLQEQVSRLNSELVAARERLKATRIEYQESDEDKDEQIESLQLEMTKLAQQVETTWEYLSNERDCNSSLRQQLHSCNESNAAMAKELRQLKDEFKFLRRKNQELQQRLQSEVGANNVDELQLQVAQLQKTLDATQNEHQAVINELKAAQNTLESSVGEVEALKRANHDLRAHNDELSLTCHRWQKSYAEVETLTKQQRDEVYAKTAEAQRSAEELQMASVALNEVQCELQFVKADLDRACSDLTDEQMAGERAQAELLAAKDRLEEARLELQNVKMELHETQTELHTMTARWRESENSVDAFAQKFALEVNVLHATIDNLRRENDALRRQCDAYVTRYENLLHSTSELAAKARSSFDDVAQVVCQLQRRWPRPKTVADADVQCEAAETSAEIQADERETYELLLEDARSELNTLRLRYDEVKEQLAQKDDECYAEIDRYGTLVSQVQGELADVRQRLIDTERELRQRNEDLQTLKTDLEDRLQSTVTEYELERQQYRRRIDELQRNAAEPKTSEMVDVGVQIFGDDDDEDDQRPGLIKYLGYYKEKMTKGFTEILSPEDQQTVDYSNWILPDEPVAERRMATEAQTVNLARERRTESAEPPSPVAKASISSIVDRLKNVVVASHTDNEGWNVDEDVEWSGSQLQLDDAEFVSTAFKFVDLFHEVVRHYAGLPATDTVLEKFGSVVTAIKPSEPAAATAVDCRETFEQVVTLTTHLENENKHLVDAIVYLEDLLAPRAADAVRFQSVIDEWRSVVAVDGDDVIDRICEEYDIVPAKFVPDQMLIQWKEQIARIARATSSPQPSRTFPVAIVDDLQTLKKKVHKLICDLHYVYKERETFNPADFFAQIEDINHAVETSAKMALSSVADESVATLSAAAAHGEHQHQQGHAHREHDHGSDRHEHEHNHRHEHEHEHGHHHHEQEHGHDHEHTADDRHETPPTTSHELDTQRDTVAELKSLLGESNKKIDKLVKELMEVKNSREYNEVRQLHTKLDETLYQLHVRDVHVVELSRELAQLLSERDALQLKLSNIIRQNEELREIAVSNTATKSLMQPPDLENKLEELHTVNYMKDPRISEASKQYHVTGMQLYNEEQRSKQESSTSIVPSILKWFTGDTEDK